MLLISQVTSDPLQVRTLTLPDGTQLGLTIYFIQNQLGWFITSLTYGSFTLQGIRITNSPNILHQWRNIIPFGLGCFSQSNREPTQQQDFSSGASTLYILTQAECEEYAELLANG